MVRALRVGILLIAALAVLSSACSDSKTVRIEDSTTTTEAGTEGSSTTTTTEGGGTSTTEAVQTTGGSPAYLDLLADLAAAEDYCDAVLIMEDVYGGLGDPENMDAAQLEQFLVFLGQAAATVGNKAPEELKAHYDTIANIWPEVLAEAAAVGFDPVVVLADDFGEAINTDTAREANNAIVEYDEANCLGTGE